MPSNSLRDSSRPDASTLETFLKHQDHRLARAWFLFSFLVVAILAQNILMGQELASESRPPDLTGIKCIVDGKRNANIVHALPYRDGLIYFSSQSSAQRFRIFAFEKRTSTSNAEASYIDALQTKANHQLALTGQYVQTTCPLSNEAIDLSLTTRLAGLEVAFANPSLLNVIEQQKSMARRAKLVFGNATFESTFRPIGQLPVLMADRDIEVNRSSQTK
ncbi:MAG: hypothetical protein AAFN77_07315 [Planctomycetota bacterium]